MKFVQKNVILYILTLRISNEFLIKVYHILKHNTLGKVQIDSFLIPRYLYYFV